MLLDRPRDARRLLEANPSDPLTPIFRAVQARRLVFYMATIAAAPMPWAKIGRAKAVLLTISDAQDGDGGPYAWACAESAIRWARPSIYVYSGAVLPVLFEVITEDAIKAGRFLLIETVPERENAWRRVLGVPLLSTRPVPAER